MAVWISQSANEKNLVIEATLNDIPVDLVEFTTKTPEPTNVTGVYDTFDQFVTSPSPLIPQVSSGQKWLYCPTPLVGEVIVILRVREEQALRQPSSWSTDELPVIAIRGLWVRDITRRFTGTVINQRIEQGTFDRTFTFVLREELLEES